MPWTSFEQSYRNGIFLVLQITKHFLMCTLSKLLDLLEWFKNIWGPFWIITIPTVRIIQYEWQFVNNVFSQLLRSFHFVHELRLNWSIWIVFNLHYWSEWTRNKLEGKLKFNFNETDKANEDECDFIARKFKQFLTIELVVSRLMNWSCIAFMPFSRRYIQSRREKR